MCRTLGIVIMTLAGAGAIEGQEPEARDTVAADSARPTTLPPLQVVRRRSRLAETPYAVSTLDRSELLRGRVSAGLDEGLVAVPGVFVANRYNWSLDQRVSIRGFGARSAFGVRGIKVMLDGIPQTLPDGQGQLTNLELSEVQSIEVLRGASSSLYGNASGGVIDIRTAGRDVTRFEPTMRTAVGEFGMTKWTAGAAVPLARGSLSLSLSRTKGDGYRDHSTFDIRQLRLRWRQELSPTTTITVHTHIADSPVLDNPGALTRAQLDADPSQADPRNVNADAGKNLTQAQVGASLTHAFGRGARFEGSVFGLRRDLINPLSFAFIDLDRWAWGTRAALTFPLSLGELEPVVTAGLDTQWQRDDRLTFDADQTAMRLDQLERVTEIGPFVQATLQPSSRVSLSAGARWDRVSFSADDDLLTDGDDSGDRVLSSLSWNLGIAADVTAAFQPYANVGTSFETPTTTELVNRPDGQGGFNVDLDPQRATNLEVGVRGIIAGRAQYGATVFRTWVRDELIPFEVPSQPNRRFFRNAGSAFHRGLELELASDLGAGFVVRGAYTFSDHVFDEFVTEDDVFDGNEIPGVPRHAMYLSVRYEAPVGVWFAADNTVNSSYYVDDANTTENDAWAVVGLRAGWDGRVGSARVAPFVGVLNLFDERYVSSVVVNAFGGRYFESAPGRNAYIGLSIAPGR